jgi:hypothetical protein
MEVSRTAVAKPMTPRPNFPLDSGVNSRVYDGLMRSAATNDKDVCPRRHRNRFGGIHGGIWLPFRRVAGRGDRFPAIWRTCALPGAKTSAEWRLFGIYYDDWRTVFKVDSRPAAARQADMNPIRMGTIGGHFLHSARTRLGTTDLVL